MAVKKKDNINIVDGAVETLTLGQSFSPESLKKIIQKNTGRSVINKTIKLKKKKSYNSVSMTVANNKMGEKIQFFEARPIQSSAST